MMDEAAYRNYRAQLDLILLNGTARSLRKFMVRHGLPDPGRDAAKVTFHKTITAAKTLPIERRRASKAWLVARGYYGLDDGDL